MEQTITAKIRIYHAESQAEALEQMMEAYQGACSYVSVYVHDTRVTDYNVLREELYQQIRYGFRLGAQTAQSVIKTTTAAYKAMKSNGHKWTEAEFKKPCLDLVRGRDYGFTKGCVSIWSVCVRQKIAYTDKDMEKYFDSSVYKFGTAKLVHRGDLWFPYVPVTFDAPECDESNPTDVVGVDLGVNFVAVYCDNAGKTVFVPGKALKNKRTDYKKNRRDLQKRKPHNQDSA